MDKLKSITLFIKQQGIMELIILSILLLQKRAARKISIGGHRGILSAVYKALDKGLSFNSHQALKKKKTFFFYTYDEIKAFNISPDSGCLVECCRLLNNNKLTIGYNYEINLSKNNFFITDVWTQREYSKELTKNAFFSDVEKIDGDPRTLWEINRLQFLVLLSQGYVLTRNEEFSEKIFQMVGQWREQNPYGRGVNWIDTQEVGIRMVSLILTRELLLSTGMHNNRVEGWTELIEQHAYFVFSNLSIGRMTHNHFLTELTSLLIFSMTCRGDFKYRFFWFYLSKTLLLREVSKQLNDDGMSAEGSTSYTLFDYDAIFMANVFYRKLFKENLFPSKVFQNMSKVICQFTVNEKDFVKIGDADCGRYNRLNWSSELSRKGYLPVIEHYFQIDTEPKRYCISPELFWILPDRYEDPYGKSEVGGCESAPVLFSDSGYLTYKLRDKHLVLRFGPSKTTPGVRFSHTHSDFLSFSFYVNGEPIFCDPGTYTYLGKNSQRTALRSVANHNSVTLDEQEFVDIKRFTFGIPELKISSIGQLQKIDQLYLVSSRFYYGKQEYVERVFVFDKELRFLVLLDSAASVNALLLIENYLISGKVKKIGMDSVEILNNSIMTRIKFMDIVGTTQNTNIDDAYFAPRYGVINSIRKCQRVVKMTNGKVRSLSVIYQGEEPKVKYVNDTLTIDSGSGVSVIRTRYS